MIDLEQKVLVKWNNANKKHYVQLGYKFTKINDVFEVYLKDVPQSSSVSVVVVCDFCGQQYNPTYKNYNACFKKHHKSSCRACFPKLAKETMKQKYGVEHYQQTEECKNRKIQSCLLRYGVENPSQSFEIQQKKRQTNIDKFGTEWFVQSEQYKNFCIENFGEDNPMKNEDIKVKALQSMFENESVPISKPERQLIGLLKQWYGEERCIPCYQESRIVMDCLLMIRGLLIDVEYDGAYWHDFRPQYDRARDEFLKSRGYKILRIVSKKQMPTFEQIEEAIEYLAQGHDFSKIDLT